MTRKSHFSRYCTCVPTASNMYVLVKDPHPHAPLRKSLRISARTALRSHCYPSSNKLFKTIYMYESLQFLSRPSIPDTVGNAYVCTRIASFSSTMLFATPIN